MINPSRCAGESKSSFAFESTFVAGIIILGVFPKAVCNEKLGDLVHMINRFTATLDDSKPVGMSHMAWSTDKRRL